MLLSKGKSVSVAILKLYNRFHTCKVVTLTATADGWLPGGKTTAKINDS